MGRGTRVLVRFAPQEEHDLILDVEPRIVVNALCGIGESVADEDNLCPEVGRGGIQYGQKIYSTPERRTGAGGDQFEEQLVALSKIFETTRSLPLPSTLNVRFSPSRKLPWIRAISPI